METLVMCTAVQGTGTRNPGRATSSSGLVCLPSKKQAEASLSRTKQSFCYSQL